MKNIKILLFLLIAVVSLSAFKCGKKQGGGASVPNAGIPLEKFCGTLTDFQTSPKGARVSSCGATVSPDFLTVVDDACTAHTEAIRKYYPNWNIGVDPSACDILLLEPDGILTTIENYPRPYLTVQGTSTAGTVLLGEFRSIVVLPHYAGINWSNKHYEFYSVYHEEEHAAGFRNRGNNPANEYLNYVGAGDVHPQKPYLEEFLPDYARTFPRKPIDGLKEFAPVKLSPDQEKLLGEWLNERQANIAQRIN